MKRTEAKRREYPYTVRGTVRVTKTQNRGRDSFVVSYVSPAEGRKQRRFTDPAAADAEARSVADILAREGAEGMKLGAADRAALVAAQRALDGTDTSLVAACEAFAAAFKVLGSNDIVRAAEYFAKHSPDRLPFKTVQQAAEEYLADRAARGKSPKYLKDIRLRLVRGLGEAFRCGIGSVTTPQLRAYLQALKGGALHRDGHRRVIRGLFNFARKQGWLPAGSPTAVDGIDAFESPDRVPEIFTPEEVDALLRAASLDFQPWLALIAFGGLRHEEMRKGLAWSDIDQRTGTLIVPAAIAKTGQRRIVTLPDNLLAWLAPHAKRQGPIYDRNPRAAMQAASRGAGVPWRTNALRHSFATYRLAQVKSAGQVALEMGNSAGIVSRHYAELIRDPVVVARYWNIRPTLPGNVVSIASA